MKLAVINLDQLPLYFFLSFSSPSYFLKLSSSCSVFLFQLLSMQNLISPPASSLLSKLSFSLWFFTGPSLVISLKPPPLQPPLHVTNTLPLFVTNTKRSSLSSTASEYIPQTRVLHLLPLSQTTHFLNKQDAII